MEVGTA